MAERKTQKTEAKAASREDRLKAALKANMARRKAQAKARADNADNADGQTGSSEE